MNRPTATGSDDEPAATVERLLSDGRSFIRCGCGFAVVGKDETGMRWALQDHECPNAPQSAWYAHVARVVFALAMIALVAWLLS